MSTTKHDARASSAPLPVERVEAVALRIPTDRPESDGTLAWDATTMVIARARAGALTGIGWTFAHRAAAELVTGPLARAVTGRDATAIAAAWVAMTRAVRNMGRPGLAWEAISAVDVALWDLKAKLLGVSVADLLGRVQDSVPLYGSGGFTSYDDRALEEQLGSWAARGFSAVKMKVGRHPADDLERVKRARRAIGPEVELFVDANGAWSRKQALAAAESFAKERVTWLEEPVSSEDLNGLRLVRDRAPAGMDVSAGEYGYVLADFRRLLVADCLDVVQADVTRCGGITGILAVAAMCEGFGVPLSTHCAPFLHAHVGCALRPLRHVEYFYDHVRIERLVLDGVPEPRGGRLTPDASAPGLGVRLRDDALAWAYGT